MKDKKLMQQIVSRLEYGPGLILLHHNADIDAIGSAIALKLAYPDFSIGAFQNISHLSKKLLDHFENISVFSNPVVEDFKTIVILDTSSYSQLGYNEKLPPDHIVIDHHAPTDNWDTDYYYCDDSKSSCAEIILDLLELKKTPITPEIAMVLSVAILADTGHFKFATNETFITYAKLLNLGNLNSGDVFEILNNADELDNSQRIAHLKGAQRLRFEQISGYLVASSILSSYEASMCKNLIILGADVAFVGAQRDDQIRISGRITRKLINKGIHLGEFFKELGDEISAEGGGHDGAAGLNGVGDVEMVLNLCTNKISAILKNI
jgi:nanoRNase/pAp phosphatase (c-di-AMP/oligoRNAs hydrolase)